MYTYQLLHNMCGTCTIRLRCCRKTSDKVSVWQLCCCQMRDIFVEKRKPFRRLGSWECLQVFVKPATAGLFPAIVDDKVRCSVCVQQCPSRVEIGSIQGRALPLLDIVGN